MFMKIPVLIGLSFALTLTTTHAAKPTDVYAKKWCTENEGTQGVQLESQDKVDCLTDKFAVNAVYAEKLKEGIGSSLYTALKLKRKPGLLVILRKPSDKEFVEQLKETNKHFKIGIQYWTINTFVEEQPEVAEVKRDRRDDNKSRGRVKLSKLNRCHDTNSDRYTSVGNIRRWFDSMEDCIASGGKPYPGFHPSDATKPL